MPINCYDSSDFLTVIYQPDYERWTLCPLKLRVDFSYSTRIFEISFFNFFSLAENFLSIQKKKEFLILRS